MNTGGDKVYFWKEKRYNWKGRLIKRGRKNSFTSNFLIPVGYAVLVYAIWEGIGFFASFVIGKITGNWGEAFNNTYVVMLLQEISVFLILYVLFHKKVDFVRSLSYIKSQQGKDGESFEGLYQSM